MPPEKLRVFVLWAQSDTLKARLAGRGEGTDSWPARQIDRCCGGLKAMPGQVVPTDGRTMEQVISIILSNIK